MQWEKLERSYAALEATLRSLKPDDRFNLILFNQDVTPFQPATGRCQHPPPSSRRSTSSVPASSAAAPTSSKPSPQRSPKAPQSEHLYRPASPTAAPTAARPFFPRKIAARYTALWKASPHPPHTDVFAVGDDANLPLLRKLAQNGGFLEPVLSTEPVDFHLQSFLSKLTRNPVAGLTLTAPIPPLKPPTSTHSTSPSTPAPSQIGSASTPRRPSPSTSPPRATRDGLALEAKASTPIPAVNPDHPQLPRLWAQARVNALLEQIDREGETTAAIDEIIRLSRRYKFVTPYTSFLAVPRSLLRPRVIRPGDPVLRVRTDAQITSVIALFPFGLTKPLRHLASEDLQAPGDDANRLWETRFLAPPEMKDGTYSVRLILRDTHGNTYNEAKTFVIASTPPTVKLQLNRTSLHRGETLEIRAAATASTRTLTARLEGVTPVTMHWNPRAQTNTGTLSIPADLPIGRYTLTITAEDIAHNLGTQEVPIDVLP